MKNVIVLGIITLSQINYSQTEVSYQKAVGQITNN